MNLLFFLFTVLGHIPFVNWIFMVEFDILGLVGVGRLGFGIFKADFYTAFGVFLLVGFLLVIFFIGGFFFISDLFI